MSGPIELSVLPTAPRPAAEEPEPIVAGRRFRVEGMDCAACARTVEKTVAALDGIIAARVSFGTATLVVEGDSPEVMAAVDRAGYRARPATRRAVRASTPFWRRDARAVDHRVGGAAAARHEVGQIRCRHRERRVHDGQMPRGMRRITTRSRCPSAAACCQAMRSRRWTS